MLLLIAPFSGSFDEKWLTYSYFWEDSINAWELVEVPLREKKIIWVVLDTALWDKKESEKQGIKEIIQKKSSLKLFDYQLFLIAFIAEYYFTAVHNSALLFFPKNVREKIEKEKLKFKEIEYNYSFQYKKTLSQEQEKVLEEIRKSKEKKILFWGLTGSGKTEVYIHRINDIIQSWKQVLILVPEIILSSQLWNRLKEVFWGQVLVISSLLTEATKTQYWGDIYTWKAKIIIGTRSALFYPYKNLGLIIQDEEHDMSYTSDSSPRYHTSEIVEKISELLDIPIIFASGTPSITKIYKAKKWEYTLVQLLKKYREKEEK